MLTMQDPNDGGVYHKCTNADFDGMVMPGVTKLPRYVVQKGTAATLDFAAVTAQASRILKHYKKQLPGLADSCLKASKKAWEWAIQNPALVYDQNKNESTYLNPRSLPAVMVIEIFATNGFGQRLSCMQPHGQRVLATPLQRIIQDSNVHYPHGATSACLGVIL